MLTATEKKALTLTTFAAACICFAPAEFVSGTMLLIASAVLYWRIWPHDERGGPTSAPALEPRASASGPEPRP
jgi:hypothetical protein